MPGFKVENFGEGASSLKEVYYSYTWDITKVFSDAVTVDSPLYFVKDISFPVWSIERDYIEGSAINYGVPKSVTFEDVRITWYDTDGLSEIVNKWLSNIWTPERGFSPLDEFVADTIISKFLPNGTKRISFKLVNSWPTKVKEGELTYTGSEVKQIEAILAYSWSEQTNG